MNELYQAIKKKRYDFEETPRLKNKTQGYEKKFIEDDGKLSKTDDYDEERIKRIV